jgi:hypothetical protein
MVATGRVVAMKVVQVEEVAAALGQVLLLLR